MSDLSPEEFQALMTRYAEDVYNDPEDNDTWLRIGDVLGTNQIEVHDTVWDRTYCYKRCLDNDDYYWRAWYNLGLVLPPNERVLVRGTQYDRQECLIKCLELEDSQETAGAWLQLGLILSASKQTAVVNGESVDDRDCYALAVKRNPSLGDAWHNLGIVSPNGVTIDGQTTTSQQCIVKAIEQDNAFARAWYSLARSLFLERCETQLPASVRIAGVGTVDEKDAVIRALHYDPHLSYAWSLLANILMDRKLQNIEVDQHSFGVMEALQRSLKESNKNFIAWCNLAPLLTADHPTKIEATGEEHTPVSVSERSLSLYQHNPIAWYNLGLGLGGETATINGTAYNEQACYLNALRASPNYGKAWIALSRTMNLHDSIDVNGNNMTKYDCFARGELLTQEQPRTPVPASLPAGRASIATTEVEL